MQPVIAKSKTDKEGRVFINEYQGVQMNESKTYHDCSNNHKTQITPTFPDMYDDDTGSLRSFSATSSMYQCADFHSVVPRNGTTFSGKNKKYVFHHSQFAGQSGSQYLTPTQRAQKHIKRLRELLLQAKLDMDEKESALLMLTKEVIELRSLKASLNSPEEKSNSSDAITVKENSINDIANSSSDASPITADIDECKSYCQEPQAYYEKKKDVSEMHSSFADSGLFEDMTNMSIHIKDFSFNTRDQDSGVNNHINEERQALVEMYERKIEDLIKISDCEKQDIAKKFNEKIETILQSLSDANARFHDVYPDYEQAKERVHELEQALKSLQKKLEEQEDKNNKMYLHLVVKSNDFLKTKNDATALSLLKNQRVTVPILVEQLNLTQTELNYLKDTDYAGETHSNLLSVKEAISLWLLGARKEMYGRLVNSDKKYNRMDPDVKLQFLKSAIFYFLTDEHHCETHLLAIQDILEFSESEKEQVKKMKIKKFQK
uniref:CSON011423 protein n=2 Tax=Culicoides sonorensis TaxID=179676 RepID=A0A336M3G4_CULSO